MQEKHILTAKLLFIFYLVISSNFILHLFGCRIQRLFTHSMYLKHILGFFVLYFFVSLDEPGSIIPADPTKRLLYSAGIYLWFLATTRMNISFWIAFIVLLMASYIIQIYKEYEIKQQGNVDHHTEKVAAMHKVQTYLLYTAAAITLVGFVHYLGEKKYEYGSNFSYSRFMFDKPACMQEKLHASDPIQLMNSIKLALFNIPVNPVKTA